MVLSLGKERLLGVDVNDFKYEGKNKNAFKLRKYPTDAGVDKEESEKYHALTAENTAKIAALQDKLYAQGEEALLIALQAMDAAGKDSTIKKVLSGVNPQGVKVTSFKSPNSIELAHDYLWRVVNALPERGYIGVFNRSHYEDVLVVRVHEYWKHYKWASRCQDMSEAEFFKKRFETIRAFEEHLYDNGYRIIKIFLHVGKDAQKERFLARIEDETKNWKFSESDLKERALWDDYMDAYEQAIKYTSTEHNPWYIIPADKKWMTQYLVSCVVLETLKSIDPHYPEMPEDQVARLGASKAALLAEDGPVEDGSAEGGFAKGASVDESELGAAAESETEGDKESKAKKGKKAKKDKGKKKK